jgi:secreted trypsin-like serine protease
MIQCRLLTLVFALIATPTLAVVGGGGAPAENIARAIVTVIGSRGTFCSGALIAPNLVLSAAHCITPGTAYKLVLYDAQRQPQLLDIKRVATHPQFSAQSILAHRASADVALLQLAEPIPNSKMAAPLGVPAVPISAGNRFLVAGIGVSKRGDGKSGGTVRSASLVATDRPGNLQIRLVDPATGNTRAGLGACTGDSGAPVFEEQNGRAVIVGVVSWSTGPNNSDGCGGLTGVTPLSLYKSWITETALKLGSPIGQRP